MTALATGTSSAECAKKIAELASSLADKDVEVCRRAKRRMWEIVRQVGAPPAAGEKAEVVAALNRLLQDGQPVAVCREVLWMLSEIGGDASVEPIARLLSNEPAREDARMAIERIPGDRSLAALKTALDTVPEDFKLNIAQSLRARGVEVRGIPCQKLTPSKQTKVGAT